MRGYVCMTETVIHKDNKTRGVSRKDFASRWGLSERYVSDLIAEGVLPSIKLSRKCVRLPLEEADEALLSLQTGGAK